MRPIVTVPFAPGALLILWLVVGCSSGGSGGSVIPPDPDPELVGEFVLAITAQDGCGFGTQDVPTEIVVADVTDTTAEVNIPDFEDICAPRTFERVENVLMLERQSALTVGTCDMDVMISTVLTFENDGSVVGSETNLLTQSGGDCSGLTLPCEIDLTAIGQVCDRRFDCVNTPPAASFLGSLASAGGPVIPPDPDPELAGEFMLSITVQDDCGFGTEDVMTEMDVADVTDTMAEVNVPDSENGCDPRVFDRAGNVLTLERESALIIGSCNMDVMITTTFTFENDGSVGGSETNSLSQSGGDCSGLTLPCQIVLTATGQTCDGCFDCVVETAPASRPLGTLAGAGSP